MTALTEPIRLGDVVKWEVNPNFTRKKLTLLRVIGQATDLVPGTLLEDAGGGDAGKKIVVTDGDICEAVLAETVEAADLAAGNVAAVCLVRGPAIIDSDRVTVTGNQKTDALAALLLLGIVAATEPASISEGLESGL